ncbi:hypothetical protein ACP70R_005488 [Stipagrostis hirtigluma subsp. patula]
MGSNLKFLGVLLLLYLWVTPSSSDPSVQAHDYLRFADVERHCQPVLSSAAALADDSYRPTRMKYELSFEKGDWHQDADAAPLMPFDGSDVPVGGARQTLSPLLLSTFVITHVDEGHRAAMAVNVSGVLTLSISRKSRDPETGPYLPLRSLSPEFKLSPGTTRLKIIFEGVYTENADGEKVLCMVGNALLPKRSAGGAGPWDWAKSFRRSSFLSPVTADDSVLLVLRYPKELTLTTRAVVGEMRSTRATSAAAYFDPVQLVSQLFSIYQYRSDDLVAGACSPLPSIGDADNALGSRARHQYNGSNLREVLERYGYGLQGVVITLPKRHCNSTATGGAACRSLGPFEVDRAAEEEELAGVSIQMQDLRCYRDTAGTVRVSVVFRAIPPWEDRCAAVRRSGVSGTTLSAEGVWAASAGQACLVACRGVGNETCHFRVCLYMPMTFSITRRSVLLGRITSIDAPAAGEAAQPSLSFGLGLSLPQFWFDGERLAFAYNYTKVKRAGELLRRCESTYGLREIVAMWVPLRYPRADRYIGDEKRSLLILADELALRFTTRPSMFTPEWMEQPALHLEVIFAGQVSDRYMARVNDAPTTVSSVASNRLVNVSAVLTAFGQFRVTSPVVSLEGVYNPEDGRMYLVGCWDVGFRRRNSSTASMNDLDEGMDCSIEVKVQYPPTTAHWFIWSAAKVHIASTRNAGDPLRFDTMKLQAVPIGYPQPRPGEISRKLVNGVLSVTLQSAAVAAALSQLRHLKMHADVAPYVSLVMLGVQALGLGTPLVMGMEALLARPTSRSDAAAMPPMASSGLTYALAASRPYQSIDLAVKVLSLAAVAVTLRVGLKVRRSRARALARSSPLEPGRVPGDGMVLVYHCAAHFIVFVLILALSGGQQAMTVEQQVALMQDLFLLPQAVGNAAWRVNCRPLAEGYYLGVTAARLLPRAYDAVRPPAAVGDSVESVSASRRVFCDAGDVVVPCVAVLLALAVFVQQRWNYAIVGWMGVAEQRKLQHVF